MRNSIFQNRTEQNRTEQNRTEQNRTEQNRTEQNRIRASFQCFKFLSLFYGFFCIGSLQAQLYADPPIMNGLPDVGIGKMIPEGRLHIDRTDCLPSVYFENSPLPVLEKKHIVLESTKRYDCSTFVLDNGNNLPNVSQKWIINGNEYAGLEIETSHDGINYIDLALFNEVHTYLYAQSFSFGNFLKINNNNSNFNSTINKFSGAKHLFPTGGIKFYDEVNINGNIIRTASQNNSLEWYTSGWGADYGHKIYNKDPGNHTELVIAAQHGSGVWTDAINISSDGKVGIGGVTGTDFDNSSEKLIVNGNIKIKNNLQVDNKILATRIDVEGKIFAREVEITVNPFPDYVFKESYHLKTIDELKKFIAKNGHLPNIPKETDYIDSRVNIGEQIRLQLEKIEELSLYVIKLHEDIQLLEVKLNNQNK